MKLNIEVLVAIINGCFGIATIVINEWMRSRRIRKYEQLLKRHEQLVVDEQSSVSEAPQIKGVSQLVSVLFLLLLSIICFSVGELASRVTGSFINGMSILALSIPVLFFYSFYVAIRYRHMFAFVLGLAIVGIFYGSLESINRYYFGM